MEITGLRQTITTEYNLKQIFIVTFFHYFQSILLFEQNVDWKEKV